MDLLIQVLFDIASYRIVKIRLFSVKPIQILFLDHLQPEDAGSSLLRNTIYQSTRCLQRVKHEPIHIKSSERSASKKLSRFNSS